MRHLHGLISYATVNGEEFQFFVADPDDVIQHSHVVGLFYEAEELAIISEFFPPGGVFVDIGANVGNHTIYVGRFLHPRQAIPFEPNPAAIEILRINLALNGLQRVADLSHLGVGLSDTPGNAQIKAPAHNLGAAHLEMSDGAGALPLIRGDSVLSQRCVDFIKMDVEGMELRVLAGLDATITQWRPAMFIEVENGNAEAFREWLKLHNYVTERTYRRYDANENYMVIPREMAKNAGSSFYISFVEPGSQFLPAGR
jgi:FkbM family methyltransferase